MTTFTPLQGSFPIQTFRHKCFIAIYGPVLWPIALQEDLPYFQMS